MGVNKEEISKALIELEKSHNERFSVGDPNGYLDGFADEVSYSNPNIVRSEYLNPAVHVSGSGDFAVMGYNLHTYVLDENGREKHLRAWTPRTATAASMASG